jgi:undecaprenyl-diphosphatase
MWADLVQIDRDLFKFLNGLWIGEFHSFWIFATHIENWIPFYLFIFYLFYKKLSKPSNFIAMALVFVVASITLFITNITKNYTERLRPNNEPLLMDSIRILQTPESFSFWSGHSAVSFAIATFSVLLLKRVIASRWVYAIYIWPVTFSFSRIFVGVHYPADIAAGMLVGIMLGLLMAHLFHYSTTRLFHST